MPCTVHSTVRYGTHLEQPHIDPPWSWCRASLSGMHMRLGSSFPHLTLISSIHSFIHSFFNGSIFQIPRCTSTSSCGSSVAEWSGVGFRLELNYSKRSGTWGVFDNATRIIGALQLTYDEHTWTYAGNVPSACETWCLLHIQTKTFPFLFETGSASGDVPIC